MKSHVIIAEFQRASRLTGIFSRVATKLGVTPNHVREVALGNRVSDRVMRGLSAELKRLERAGQNKTDAERAA